VVLGAPYGSSAAAVAVAVAVAGAAGKGGLVGLVRAAEGNGSDVFRVPSYMRGM
jgi:hypothetical protein